MPRKKTVPTEPQPDPPAEITEATVEPAPNPIEQPNPDILDGALRLGRTWRLRLCRQKLTPKPK